MPIKIYLSPSNQTRNLYNDGRNECDVCYATAKRVFDLITQTDGVVAYIPSKGSSIYTNISESNKMKCDYHIPIHTNAGGGVGTRIFVYPTNKDMRLAKEILKSVGEWSIGNIDRIETNVSFAEIIKTDARAIYVEGEFHDTNGDHIDPIEYGNAIYEGICNGIGLTSVLRDQNSGDISPESTDKLYRVQIGAYKERKNAESMCETLKKAYGLTTYISWY